MGSSFNTDTVQICIATTKYASTSLKVEQRMKYFAGNWLNSNKRHLAQLPRVM